MSNFRFKVKINNFFPKVKAIPYDEYICIISCNNTSSKIALSEYKYQSYQHIIKLIKDKNLAFKIRLVNYLHNNSIVGTYDLLFPCNKINQILQRKTSYYHQQIQLLMNSNVKIEENKKKELLKSKGSNINNNGANPK